MKLFKKSLMLIASFGLFLSGALAINIQKEVKQAGATTEVTVHSNFASNVTDPDTAGFLNSNGSKKYLAVDSGTDGANLSSSNLFLFLGSQKDSNVSLTFKGNQTNYPKGNCVSNTGVLALKYGSTEKGGEFVIETSDVDKYIITSVSITSDASTSSGTSGKIVVTGLDNTEVMNTSAVASTFFTSENGYIYTYSLAAGIKKFSYANVRATPHADASFTDISVTYTAVDKYLVTFDSDGGTSIDPQLVASGGKVSEPADPTKSPDIQYTYTFSKWLDENNQEFDFINTVITKDTTLHALWDSEEIAGYELTFESNGGTSVPSQVVPTDGTKFVKPDNPTREKDGVYQYTFKKWYANEELTVDFDFNATPTGDTVAYAGWTNAGYAPSGYKTLDPKGNASSWASEYTSFGAFSINTYNTVDTSKKCAEMTMSYSSTGSSTSGAKNVNDSEIIVNNTDIALSIIDPTKYFSAIRVEFYVKDYTQANAKTITLSTDGVVSDSGLSPYDSKTHSSLVLIGDCTTKPQTFVAHVPHISSAGTRLRYIYATFGEYTTGEMAANYAKAFNAANVCGTSDYDGVDDTAWGQQETAYLALPLAVREYLRDYEVSGNTELDQAIERYNTAVSKHGEDYDFMGRIAANKVTLNGTPSINVINNNNNMIIVVTIVCLIATTTIVAFALTKRKKHE